MDLGHGQWGKQNSSQGQGGKSDNQSLEGEKEQEGEKEATGHSTAFPELGMFLIVGLHGMPPSMCWGECPVLFVSHGPSRLVRYTGLLPTSYSRGRPSDLPKVPRRQYWVPRTSALHLDLLHPVPASNRQSMILGVSFSSFLNLSFLIRLLEVNQKFPKVPT